MIKTRVLAIGQDFEKVDTGIVAASQLSAVSDVGESQKAQSRSRDTYTVEEVAIIDRAAKVLTSHGDKMRIRCGAQLCSDRNIELKNDATVQTGAVLRCGCTDRVFMRPTGGRELLARAASRRQKRHAKRLRGK